MTDIICKDCNTLVIEPNYVDDSFDYAGTHCTGGVGGTYHIGYWECPRCGGELDNYAPDTYEDFDEVRHNEL